MSLSSVVAALRISPFPSWIQCADVRLHLEHVFNVLCRHAVDHSWRVQFRLTKVQTVPHPSRVSGPFQALTAWKRSNLLHHQVE